MTSPGLSRADSYHSYNTRAAGPERVSFSSFGADPEGSPLDKWVAAWLGRLEPQFGDVCIRALRPSAVSRAAN